MTSFLGWRPERRLIDQLPPPKHPRTMKVLCLGAPRTGTSSMTAALQQLGYTCYEGFGHSFRHENRFPHWSEALDAKFFNKGQPYSADDLDKILGGYEMTCSFPSVLFADELLAAYPDAKVILTTRNVDSWLESVRSTIWMVQSWKRSWSVLTIFNRGLLKDFREMGTRCSAVWDFEDEWEPEKVKANFLRHYEHIRKVVPKERMLEHKPADGWVPLCEFLGKPVPDMEYPRVLDAQLFRSFMYKLWWISAGIAVVEVTIAGCAIAALWRYWDSDVLRNIRSSLHILH